MIKLDVHDRCHECSEFCPAKEESCLYTDDHLVFRETRVVCANASLCKYLLKYLQEGLQSSEIKEEH